MLFNRSEKVANFGIHWCQDAKRFPPSSLSSLCVRHLQSIASTTELLAFFVRFLKMGELPISPFRRQ